MCVTFMMRPKNGHCHTIGLIVAVNSDVVFTLVWNFQGCEQGFTHISDNAFTNSHELIPFGGGIRIDYILFKVNVFKFTVRQMLSASHLHSLAIF